MKRFLSSVCVLCALLLWTGCAAQAPASSFAPASAPEAQSLPSAPPAASSLPTETPPYTGPLYEVTVEALPEAAEITFPSAFEGRMVTGVSGYRDGVCIVATRSLDPAEVTGPYDVYEGGYYEDTTWYRIDRAGAVLGESTKEEFSEYRDALTDRGIHLHDAVYSGENEFGPVPTRVQSVVVAEGLIARADGSDVVLEDANGTVYPIELPEGCRAVNVFGADGMAWILLSENRDSVYGMGSDFYTHIVRLRSIMPEDYVVPDAFAQRGAVLDYEAAELPPLPKPEEGGAQSGEQGSHAIDEEEMDDLLEIPEEERRMHEQVLIAFENLAREQQMDAGNPTAAILRLRLKM